MLADQLSAAFERVERRATVLSGLLPVGQQLPDRARWCGRRLFRARLVMGGRGFTTR